MSILEYALRFFSRCGPFSRLASFENGSPQDLRRRYAEDEAEHRGFRLDYRCDLIFKILRDVKRWHRSLDAQFLVIRSKKVEHPLGGVCVERLSSRILCSLRILSWRRAAALCVLLSTLLFAWLGRRDVLSLRALKALIPTPTVVDATTVPSHKELETIAGAMQASPVGRGLARARRYKRPPAFCTNTRASSAQLCLVKLLLLDILLEECSDQLRDLRSFFL
jgi:hypothetical protein